MNLVSFRCEKRSFSSAAFFFFFSSKNDRHLRYRHCPHSKTCALTHTHMHTLSDKKHNRGVQIFVRKLLEKDIATVPFGCPKPLSSETCHGSWQRLFVSAVPSFSPRLSISFSCFSNADGKLSRNATTEKTMYICVCVCLCGVCFVRT